MKVRTDSQSGPAVPSCAESLQQIQAQLGTQQSAWLEQLKSQPQQFAQLEVQIHHVFGHLADQLVAALLAEASRSSAALDAAKKK